MAEYSRLKSPQAAYDVGSFVPGVLGWGRRGGDRVPVVDLLPELVLLANPVWNSLFSGGLLAKYLSESAVSFGNRRIPRRHMRFVMTILGCTIPLVQVAILWAQPATTTATRSLPVPDAAVSGWEQSSTRDLLWGVAVAPELGWSRHFVVARADTIPLDEGLVADAGSGAALGLLIGAGVAGGAMYVVCSFTYDCPVDILTFAAGAVGGLLGAAIGAQGGSSNSDSDTDSSSALPSRESRLVLPRR